MVTTRWFELVVAYFAALLRFRIRATLGRQRTTTTVVANVVNLKDTLAVAVLHFSSATRKFLSGWAVVTIFLFIVDKGRLIEAFRLRLDRQLVHLVCRDRLTEVVAYRRVLVLGWLG